MDGRSLDEGSEPYTTGVINYWLRGAQNYVFSSLMCFICRTELIAMVSWSDLFEDLRKKKEARAKRQR